MHLNYYFLRQLSASLKEKLVGFTLEACFSQEKDELVLGFANADSEFYIKAFLTSNFSALSFPSDFHRKRQNTVNLFPELVGQAVTDVVQHRNERSFYLSFSGNFTLLFKMFGNRSNLILYRDREPISRFHKKFPNDFQLNPWAMDQDLEQPANFPLSLKELQKQLPTLGDLPIKYLQKKNFEQLEPAGQQKLAQELLAALKNPEVYYLVEFEDKIRLSLLPIGLEIAWYKNPVEAAQAFTIKYLSSQFFQTNFRLLKQNFERRLHAAESILEQTEAKQKSLQTDTSFSQTADIIMANLSNIPARATEVELYDFYLDCNRTIKLKAGETPQKTAERLYKKGKNQKIELQILGEKALRKTEEVIELEDQLQELNHVSDVRQLKQFMKTHDFAAETTKEQAESPFREFITEGFKILIGKSAKNNDILTQKHTYKEDLWLHAKDVSGSHVIIKYQAGKTFPSTVIEKAAQLAAYYSKRKTDSLCPVIYTPKKYVRKPKGAAPGSVVVDRENVILVTPGNPFERSF